MDSSANDVPTDEPTKDSEPEVVFEPSPTMVEQMNQGEERSERPRRRASEAASGHQYQAKEAAYPGQPRVPQVDEGPAALLPPDADLDALSKGVEPPAMLRDASTKLRDVAGVYVYGGKEETTHTRVGMLRPGKNDFTGFTDPELLLLLQAMANDPAIDFRKA